MGISTVVVALIDGNNEPRAAFGSSCKVSIPHAVAHAFSEAIMIARTQRLTAADDLEGKKAGLAAPRYGPDHVAVPRYVGGVGDPARLEPR